MFITGGNKYQLISDQVSINVSNRHIWIVRILQQLNYYSRVYLAHKFYMLFNIRKENINSENNQI